MDGELKKVLHNIADTIRQLSIEAIQKANSGHPGLPLGCAEIGAYLFGFALNHDPKNPTWTNRDRFILSAGHGSMLLYSCLHLTGFDISLDDIKNFRQLNSKTPGHIEYEPLFGIETTTGPLGQGIGNSVGLALAYKILAEKFNTPEHTLFDNKIYCLASDGCMMEGSSSEASSLAGHFKLNNLVIIYDSNEICLDGPVSESFSENTKERYRSYGFDIFEINGHDFNDIDSVISSLKKSQEKPALIIARTVIGKGSPKAGTHKVHGAPLGVDDVKATKKALNLPEEDFFIPLDVKKYFQKRILKQSESEKKWNELFKNWSKANPHLFKEFEIMRNQSLPYDLEERLKNLEIKAPIAGRSASQSVINFLADLLPYLYGGSADLSSSDMTMMKKYDVISSKNYKGRNIKYGVREFAMGAISNGLFLSGMIIPFAGTFLVFSDYMKSTIRLASLSHFKVIYQFTHDSIFLGEDGPTHQPIEHLASLRSIPNLHVIRPADSYEVKMAWIAALNYEGPTALILSRQALPDISQTRVPYSEGVGKGAYIVKTEKRKPDFTLFATGSELQLAFGVAEKLEKLGKDVRIVSMPCWQIFEEQTEEYKESVLGGDLGKRVSIEALSDFGWHKYIGREGIAICMNTFGLSAPMSDLAQEFGFTVENIVDRII